MPSLAHKIAPLPPDHAESRPSEPIAEVELDLERLVWDPEYRAEMRERLRPRR